MKAFRRILPYVWPQWSRLVVIFVSALLTSVLMAGTLLTAQPLLTVMLGEEGLHGLIDRKVVNARYGMDFGLPDRDSLAADPNTGYYLRVITVKKDTPAALAGIHVNDMIVGAASSKFSAEPSRSLTREILATLATTPVSQPLHVRITRLTPSAAVSINAEIDTTKRPATLLEHLNPFLAHYDAVQTTLSLLPREETKKNKELAIVYIVALMLVVTVLRCLFRFLQDYTGDKVVQTSLARLREDSFGHALDIPVGFFASQGSSDTVSRLVQDTGTIGGGLKTVLTKAVREPLTAVAMLVYAFWVSPQLTLIFLASTPLAVLAVSNFGKKMKRATKKSLANWAKVLGKLEETITALKAVKIYNRQSYEHSRFTETNRKLLRHQFRIAKVDAATDPIMEVLGMIAISGGIVFGAHWVFYQNMQPTTFFIFLASLAGSAEAVRKTSDIWNRLNMSNAAAERVFAIIDEPQEIQHPQAHELPDFRNTIEFKKVCFKYPGTEREVLKSLSLTIRAGQNIAIVGPNGSGKTTLVNLLPRFYDPSSGGIFIDGHDIQQVTFTSLRHQMAMVTQNVLTFNDTIAANIAYGRPDATRQEIIEAAQRSYAHEFIAPMPEGYDTIIGEQGAGLSGGQLQRIVIARAILKNPPIMIFDEAMSQIDADSEAKIHRALDEFMKDRTALVIAHRFSTVIKADSIVVLNEGRLIAQGVHDELVKTCGIYKSLYQTQLLKD